MTHWFRKQCGHTPDNCPVSRDGVCTFPPADCLAYEDMRDDERDCRIEMEIGRCEYDD